MVKCEKNQIEPTKLICNPTETNMPTSKGYDVYYSNQCGTLLDTGLIVNKLITISVSDISIANNLKCTMTAFTSFIISVNKPTTVPINKAILTKELSNGEVTPQIFEYTNCQLMSSYIIQCSSTIISIPIGKYSLTSLQGGDNFYLSSLTSGNTIKYIDDFLLPSSQQPLTQNQSGIFTINLLSSSTLVPYVNYKDSNSNNIGITCNKKNGLPSVIECVRAFPTNITQYSIYYTNNCGIEADSQIKVGNCPSTAGYINGVCIEGFIYTEEDESTITVRGDYTTLKNIIINYLSVFADYPKTILLSDDESVQIFKIDSPIMNSNFTILNLSDVEAEIKTKNVSLITEELIVYKLDLFNTDFLRSDVNFSIYRLNGEILNKRIYADAKVEISYPIIENSINLTKGEYYYNQGIDIYDVSDPSLMISVILIRMQMIRM